MRNFVVDTTTDSWGGRLGKSAKGICCGPVLAIISIALLFWNEGRAVARYKDLQEARGAVVSLGDINTVDSAKDGKLVHFTGAAVADGAVKDQLFGVTSDALKLRRDVQMYQWVETSRQKTTKTSGGGSKTETVYSYETTWKSSLENSNFFHEPSDHENPSTMPFQSVTTSADRIDVGAFQLSSNLIDKMSWYSALTEGISTENIQDEDIGRKAKKHGNGFYIGTDPFNPQIGDTKVEFFIVPQGTVSVMAKQSSGTLVPYTAKTGGTVLFLKQGTVTADEMLFQAEHDNATTTWILRAFGFFLMFIGLHMVVEPILILFDVIPCLGDLIEGASNLVVLLISAILSSVVIAFAWLTCRPLLGISVLLIAGGLGYVLKNKADQAKKEKAYATVMHDGKNLQFDMV